MLDTIRRAQPAIIKGVLGAVVVAFVATIFLDWGWRRSSRPDTQLATVGGESVSLREFQMIQTNLVNFYRRIYQDRFTEDFARTLNLKQQALDTLVQRKLLLREAKRQGMRVTDAELIQRVHSYPVFQVDNTFDNSRYLQVLRMSQLTPGAFEQNQREELLLMKLENLIKDAIQVTEIEVKEAFIHDTEQLNVDYLRIDPTQFAAQVEVNETDVSTYYQEHQERFRKPEQVRFAYVVIDPESFVAQIEMTDERLAQYYDEHKEEFRQDEQVRARHILFKLPEQAGAEEDARMRSEAEAALSRIRSGEDFATIATQVSQDSASAQQGGDLGFFKRGDMVKSFEEVAFGLKPGVVSELVRTDFGYHIIKVEEVQEAGYRPLAMVMEELRERLTREDLRRLAEAKAQAVRDAMVAAGDEWQAEVRTLGPEPQVTPYLARGAVVQGIEDSAALIQAAFALQDGEVSQPTSIGNRFVVLKLLERTASTIPPFEEAKESVREALVQERSQVLARQKADEFLTEVKAGRTLADLAQALNFQVEQTGLFSRKSTIQKLGRPPGFLREVFRMNEGEARVIDLLDQPAIVILNERKEFNVGAYEKEKSQLREQALRQKRDQAFTQWSNDLLRQAEERHEITINESLVAVL